jgi:hypothetical protein
MGHSYEDGIFVAYPAKQLKWYGQTPHHISNRFSSGITYQNFLLNSCRPEVDLVFVHGLRGSPFRTWRSRTDEIVEGKQTDCWPRV